MSHAQPIFQVRNKHTAGSGPPPQIDGNEKGKYYSYFENELGEQSIFVYDYEARTGTLYMGDAGWDQPVTITEDTKSDLILNEAEGLWLGGRWMAAASRDKWRLSF